MTNNKLAPLRKVIMRGVTGYQQWKLTLECGHSLIRTDKKVFSVKKVRCLECINSIPTD